MSQKLIIFVDSYEISDPRFILELFNRPLVCHLSSKVLCPCMDGPDRLGKEEIEELVESYKDSLSELVSTLDCLNRSSKKFG